jgi:anti-sigma regulatory factor (Ser/Thr protein kinase)
MTVLPASATFPNHLESIRLAETFIVSTCRALGVASASDPLFVLAVHEALTNAFRHGNKGAPGASIDCEVERAGDRLLLRIFDEGPGFSLSAVRDPQVDPRRIATLPEDGFGVPIIRSVFPLARTITRAGRFGVELVIIAGSEPALSS